MKQISGERLQDHWSSGIHTVMYKSFRNSRKPYVVEFILITVVCHYLPVCAKNGITLLPCIYVSTVCVSESDVSSDSDTRKV